MPAPMLEVSSVILQPRLCFTARMAGDDMITSPMLSALMQRILLQLLHAFIDQNILRGLFKIFCGKVRSTRIVQHPLRFIAVINEHGPAAGAFTSFYIVEYISYHPAAWQLERELFSSVQQHAGLRLPAIAFNRKLFY